MTTPGDLPDTLPEKPVGWTRKMVMHLNLGGKKGGVGTYRVFDERGVEMPITYAYGPNGVPAGFNLNIDPEDVPRRSWAELRAAWPAFVAAHRGVAAP
jgi:hypothetical protein